MDFPDVLTPTNGSTVCIQYSGGLGGAAAVQYDGSLGGGRVVNFGFPFETITTSSARDAYMWDVLGFFGVLIRPLMTEPRLDRTNNLLALSWSAVPGLSYRVQYKTNLADPTWQSLGSDVTASNTLPVKADAIGTPGRRFYRVLLVN